MSGNGAHHGAQGATTLDGDELGLALELCPDPVALVEVDGHVVTWSRSWEQTLGLRLAEGQRIDEVLHPEDRAAVLELVAEVAGRRRPAAVIDARVDAAGVARGWRWFEWTMRPDPGRRRVYLWGHDVDDRRQAEATLRSREAMLERLLDAAPAALYELDRDGRVAHVNEAWTAITGVAAVDSIGRHWSDLADAGLCAVMRSAQQGWSSGGALTTTLAIPRRDGSERWVQARLTSERAEDGTIERHVGSMEDVSVAMRDGQAGGLQTVLESTPDIVLVWDESGRIRYANGAARRILAIGRLGMVAVDDVYAPTSRQRLAQLLPGLAEEGAGVWTGELAMVGADGREIPVSQVMVHHQADDGGEHVSAIARDITEHKRRERELAHRATHDPLTGLPNRVLFLERLRHALRRDGTSVAVAFLDLDRFKLINDSLGHEVGDHLLVALATRLERIRRPSDTVARLGGDEFVVLCESVSGEADAMAIAERIQAEVGQPFPLAAGTVFVTASVGVACARAGSGVGSAEALLEQADVAMYRAKDTGRARSELFDAELRSGAAARLELKSALRTGIDRGELRVFYQPQYSLRTSALVGMEALVRWQHPDLGLVSPLEFIPVAEESGLIVPIGSFVLEESCRQAREWELRYPASAALEMHVNLSARQFAQPGLVELVQGALARAGVAPHRLCLEITESVVMDDVESTMAILLQLRELGVKVGVDDFGTGYSSLSYLKRLPVDVLKVDKSFVSRLGEDMVDSAIVSSVVNLARSLGIAVVAEGVETDQQCLELRALGCPVAQGYYFSRPLSPAAATELVAGENWR